MMQGMVLHLFYGLFAGIVVAVPALGVGITSMTTAVLFGLVYGIVLFVGAAVFWMRIVLGTKPEMPQAGMMGLFHPVYGAVLGIWLQLALL